MMMLQVGFMIVICLVIIGANAQSISNKYTVCAPPDNLNNCQQIGRTNKIECKNIAHGIDCLLNVESGSASFGRVRAEEALIAANLVKNVMYFGEFRPDARSQDAADFETVVVVKKDITSIKSLKGKRFCHPGFPVETASELILKEFENEVLRVNDVDICSSAVESNTFMIEKELKALSEFFGPSCRPGKWVQSTDVNKDLQKRYSTLCEKCDFTNTNDKCGSTIPNSNAFEKSLHCLIKDRGDFALTTLSEVNKFIDQDENKYKVDNYRFLCRDGTTKMLNNSCSWTKQPWNLIVVNKDIFANLLEDMEILVPNLIMAPKPVPYNSVPLTDEQQKYFSSIFFPERSLSYKINITEIENRMSLLDYMKDFREVPTADRVKKCDKSMKWCTTSNAEQQKCIWLAQASLNRGIQPPIECIQSEDKLKCLEDIKTTKLDIVTSDAHYGYIARKKNLAGLLYPETESSKVIRTLLVIKETKTTELTSFKSLKDKSSCFPEYGGIEWISFMQAGQDLKVFSKCNHESQISNFVGRSCIPGARDPEHEKTTNTDEDKLCSICLPNAYISKTATTCSANSSENQYYGSAGALKCLKEAGDFAVITKGDYKDVDETQLRVMCKNGSLASYPGFNVNDECALAVVIDGEVMSRKDDLRNLEYSVALLEIEKWFGQSPLKVFEAFNIFNNTLDLLFMDSTPGLNLPSSEYHYLQNYIKLFSSYDSDNCDPSSATSNTAATLLILLALFFGPNLIH